nr:winged helix-turn-helix domain-containing protein [Pseudalkalibacillus hwajinpoensis]
MGDIQFFDGDFKVKYRSEEIGFLPKEFQLLQFLYQNPSQVFTREELLNAVWTMEEPTDRTVDDHIYRVRKKLNPFSKVISIETKRGQGYVLRLNKELQKSPLLKDEEVFSNVKMLFHKYHLYGQGDALKLLEENQEVFGFKLDLQSQLYLRFMNGDFSWFIETEEATFWEKSYYLLHIYSFITVDKKKSLEYFSKALAVKELPEFHRLEIRLLNRLSLLIITKQFEKAEELLVDSKKEIQKKKLQGFLPLIFLSELYLSFHKEDSSEIKEKMNNMENLLESYPFSRERASFSILKGIQCLHMNEQLEAKNYFDEGFKLFKEAKYIPGILISLMTINHFLNEFQIQGELSHHYNQVWQRYAEEYQFDQLERTITQLFAFHFK